MDFSVTVRLGKDWRMSDLMVHLQTGSWIFFKCTFREILPSFCNRVNQLLIVASELVFETD